MLALRNSFAKLLGLMERKNWERRRPFFSRNLSQLRAKLFRNFFDSTLVSDKKKFKRKV